MPDSMRPALIRALLLAAASTVAAPALSAQFTHFQTLTPNSGAFNIASGADGNVWFTEPSVDKIGRVNLQQGRVDREFPLHPGGFPMGITAGPDGNIWFTEFNPTGNPLACHIGRLNLTSLTVDMEIPTKTPISGPLGITKGPDGNIWFTEQLANKIGCVTPTGSDCINQTPNTVAEFPIPPGFGSDPTGIASGPDNNIWFTELISDAGQRSYIGRLNLVTPGKKVGSIDHFQIPTLNSLPAGIVSGPDRNLWFTEQSVGQIGQFQMATAKFLEFGSLYAYSSPQGISAGPDGAIWFTETDGNAIGKMGINGSVLAQHQIPIPNSGPTGITVGPDGNIWFTGNSAVPFPDPASENNFVWRLYAGPPILTVTKALCPPDDPGRFDLKIVGNGVNKVVNVGNGGSTGPVKLSPGSYTVSESVPAPSKYLTTIDCGAGPPINGVSTTVTMAEDQTMTCRIANVDLTGFINSIPAVRACLDACGSFLRICLQGGRGFPLKSQCVQQFNQCQRECFGGPRELCLRLR